MSNTLSKAVKAGSRGSASYLDRVLVLASAKGGVGKTSIAANVAGKAAGDLRVLVIDLDPRGSLHRDLGYPKQDGTALFNALVQLTPLPILANVRPNLDVVPGGAAMQDISGMLLVRQMSNPESGEFADLLYAGLAPIAEEYDLIIIDTSPGEATIVQGAFTVASAVVIPSKSDGGSTDAVEGVADRFKAVRERNPRLAVAGAVLFDVGSTSRKIERNLRNELSDLLETAAPVFTTRIRHAEGAARDAREHGRLIHELDGEVEQANKLRFADFKRGIQHQPKFHTSNASGLAADYENLTQEILIRISELEAEGE
jgi:chromosome partitioning protein